ncbi:MAG: AAA family ATPase [Aquabacterium sp.]|nr:AAA family ATPase [Aquabacterium sp.]
MSLALVQSLQQRWGARLIETHISWVLLDGVHAWKIKKPVNLGFLDFSELATRHRLCEVELHLNQRLAPQLYLDVVAIRGTAQQPVLDGDAPVIEYALRMKQFEPGALLGERLQAGLLQPQQLDTLAARLASFHQAAPVATSQSPYGSTAHITQAVGQVLAGLAKQGCVQARVFWQPWLQSQSAQLGDFWAQRQATGHVIEGHGDLHLNNAVVLGDEVTAFDCIEFDPALRWIDACSDIAFMVMDLMAHSRPDLAYRFLNAYLDESGDHAGLPTLRFYLVYRALVRGLVAGIKGDQGEHDQPDYLDLAERLTQPAPPRLLITHGLSGSGKSFHTLGLLGHAQAIRVRADVERKRLVDIPDRYTPQATAQTYARLRELAYTALQAGYPVIVDATFLRRAQRDDFRQLARQLNVPFTILHCLADPATLRQRVTLRSQQGHDASEADATVLAQQWGVVEPLQEDEHACTITVDAAQPVTPEALATQWLWMEPT